MEDGGLKGEVGVQQAAHQDADEQGGVDLLGNQGQGDGDDGGNQGPEGVVETAGGLDVAHALAGFAGDGLQVLGQDDAGGPAVGALDVLGSHRLGEVLTGGQGGDGHGGAQQEHDRQQRQKPSSQISHSSLS